MGPVIINADGTTRRIDNWDQMTKSEQEVAWRRIAKRNEERRRALLEEQQQRQQNEQEVDEQEGWNHGMPALYHSFALGLSVDCGECASLLSNAGISMMLLFWLHRLENSLVVLN